MTGAQRLVAEVSQRLAPGAQVAVMRAAYKADEAPRSASEELAAYYRLADRATEWSGMALRKLRMPDYATFLAQSPIRDAYTAASAEQVLRSARMVLETHEFPDVDQVFLSKARTTLLETQKVVGFAARVRGAQTDRDLLKLGTAAAARAFVAGWGFFASAPDEARITAQAMRAAR